jgi:hypothetical protein
VVLVGDDAMSLLRSVIMDMAADSSISHYFWKGRGVAPAGYVKGMALVYARVYSRLKLNDPVVLEMAKPGGGKLDALAFYTPVFTKAGMTNNTPVERLRHLFVLMMGEGMRESSGVYCTGRDHGASNTSADTAEAGLFQTSYNVRHASAIMPIIFNRYKLMPFGFADVFKEGVTCTAKEMQNWGAGDGVEFQRLSKACPAFAVEFAAVGFRNRRDHWGPLTSLNVEVRRECDARFSEVQAVVDRFANLSSWSSIVTYGQLIF